MIDVRKTAVILNELYCLFIACFVLNAAEAVADIWGKEEAVNMVFAQRKIVKLVAAGNADHLSASVIVSAVCDCGIVLVAHVGNLVAQKSLIRIENLSWRLLVPFNAGYAVVSVCKKIVAKLIIFFNHCIEVNISVAVGGVRMKIASVSAPGILAAPDNIFIRWNDGVAVAFSRKSGCAESRRLQKQSEAEENGHYFFGFFHF